MGKYTRKNSTGDAGEYLVGYTFAGVLGWAYRILDSDTGIDGEVEIYDGEEPTGRILKVQVKSTSRLDKSITKDDNGQVHATERGFTVSVKKTDFLYWQMFALPVVLCLADITNRKVFYLPIDQHVTVPVANAETFQVTIPAAHELTAERRSGLTAIAPLRDFNPLDRLIERAEATIKEMQALGIYSLSLDSARAFTDGRGRIMGIRGAIEALLGLGGWLAHETTGDAVKQRLDNVWRSVQYLDHEIMQFESD